MSKAKRGDNRIAMTAKFARASGTDAGNKNMRKNGRHQWNEDDYDVAVAVTNSLLACVPIEHGGLEGVPEDDSRPGGLI